MSGLAERTIRRLEIHHAQAPRMTSVRLLADALGLDPAERDRFTRAARGDTRGRRARKSVGGPAAGPGGGGRVFGALLATYRRRAGLTQEKLAAKSGLAERTIRRLETHHAQAPRITSVRLLADALGLDPAERDRFIRAAHGDDDPAGGLPVPIIEADRPLTTTRSPVTPAARQWLEAARRTRRHSDSPGPRNMAVSLAATNLW